MGFSPSQTTIQNAELASRYGIAQAVPSSGGGRRTFYTNANIGGKLRIRINAVTDLHWQFNFFKRESTFHD